MPRYKIGRGWLPEEHREIDEHLRLEDQRFGAEGGTAWNAWTAGDRDAAFPCGTLQMVAQHGANVAEMHPDAVLCNSDRSALWPASPFAARDAVATACGAALEELQEQVPDAREDGVDPADLGAGPRAVDGDDAPPPVQTRGLESPVESAAREHTARLVILRNQDARRHKPEPDT